MSVRLWAVYDLLPPVNLLGPVAWPLDLHDSGEYSPVETPDMPPICPLPISVHRTRASAVRTLNLILYNCAGSA